VEVLWPVEERIETRISIVITAHSEIAVLLRREGLFPIAIWETSKFVIVVSSTAAQEKLVACFAPIAQISCFMTQISRDVIYLMSMDQVDVVF
jgi:hypothetical protein